MELKLEFEELYISGTGDILLQSKTVVPTKAEQVIIADEDYTALSKVIIEAIPNEYQDVSVVTATADKVLQGYVFVGADGNTLQGEVPIIESAEVLLSRDTAEYNIPNGYHDGNGRVRVDFEELTATPTKETQEITASENKVLSKVTVLPIPDDYVNKNEVPKPTLNAPEIYASAGTGNLIVNDLVNGIFTSEYLLYVDGVERATYTEKAIPMQEYIVSGEEQLQVRCKNDTFFNESELSNATTWNFLVNGTPGLIYSNGSWVGLGTVTAKEIYVASIVNGVIITHFNMFDAFKDTSMIDAEMIVRLPDTIISCEGRAVSGYGLGHKTFIFGANIVELRTASFYQSHDCIFDWRKVNQVPRLITAFGGSKDNIHIVRDEMYEDFITATIWAGMASSIIRESEWIAQGGTV